MLNTSSPTRIAGGVWFATIAVMVVSSVVMDARLSTSAFLLMIGVAPVVSGLSIRRFRDA